jgi:ribosomal protein L32
VWRRWRRRRRRSKEERRTTTRAKRKGSKHFPLPNPVSPPCGTLLSKHTICDYPMQIKPLSNVR